MSPERVSVGEEGEGQSKLMDQNTKGAGATRGVSGTRNLEAESIRSRAERPGGCVKLKTVTVPENGCWKLKDVTQEPPGRVLIIITLL